MYPILDRYGPFFLYSYTVALALGILAGLGLTAWRVRRRSHPRPGWIDGVLAGLVAALIGGRAGFVWANWDYFRLHPAEMWPVWRGGLSYHGALLAGLLALGGWCAWRGRSLRQMAGLLAPAGVLLSAFGWLACWLEGCAYGRETVIGPLAADLPDSFGVYAVRYRTQLLGITLSLLAFALVWWLRNRLRPGALSALALLLISAGRVAASLFRGDAVPLLGPLRLDTVLDATLALTATGALLAIALTQGLYETRNTKYATRNTKQAPT